MAQNDQLQEKVCVNCGRAIHHGRSDRRFCNDGCRNTFNWNKRENEKVQQHENLPEILKIIKRNYELLQSYYHGTIEADTAVRIKTESFLTGGFNPKFFTSIKKIHGETWRFCFERGFIIGEKYCYVRDEHSQAEPFYNDDDLR